MLSCKFLGLLQLDTGRQAKGSTPRLCRRLKLKNSLAKVLIRLGQFLASGHLGLIGCFGLFCPDPSMGQLNMAFLDRVRESHGSNEKQEEQGKVGGAGCL